MMVNPNPKLVARIQCMQGRLRMAIGQVELTHMQFEGALKLYQMAKSRNIDSAMIKNLRTRVDRTRGTWWTAIDKKMTCEMEIKKLNRQVLADMEAWYDD